MPNLKKEPTTVKIETSETLSLDELAFKIMDAVPIEDAPKFIALLEKKYESWWVSERLIKHFKQLEVDYNEGFEPYEREDLSPSSLLKKPKKKKKLHIFYLK